MSVAVAVSPDAGRAGRPSEAGSSSERRSIPRGDAPGDSSAAPLLVYFSSISGNTARFVDKLDMRALRIPLRSSEPPLRVDEPFVLITPTYGGGEGRGVERGAVPKQVIRFLNDEVNRTLLRGVISTGNTNFGESFGLAGDIISRKCHVPHLYRLEVFGTPEDVDRVSEGLERWWKLQ